MRNLKRALSLTLASVMLLGMMVVGAGAAGYPDVDDEDNIEAIEVLQAVKVMQGNDQGNFDPDSKVNRAQMAVVMANLLNLDYNYYEGSCPFWDVPDWAKPYVAACYANGIVSGYNATTYGAGDDVTAVQAASMMMRALGYFQYEEDYKAGFELATVKQANEIGLFSGLGANATAALTRNQVAKLALNALLANMVYFTGTPGTSIDLGDGKKVNVGYKGEYSPRTGTEEKYSHLGTLGDTTDVITGSGAQGRYYIQLGEELYDGKLTKTTTYDAFGRPQTTWRYDYKIIGDYLKAPKLTYTKEVKLGDIYNDLGLPKTVSAADTLFYDNGKYENVSTGGKIQTNGTTPVNLDEVGLVRGDDRKIGGNGILVQVWYDSNVIRNTQTARITLVDTYVGKVNSVVAATSSADRYVTIDEVANNATTGEKTVPGTLNVKFETEEFEARDLVMFTAAYDATGNRYNIQSADALEVTTTGTLTHWEGKAGIDIDKGTSTANFTAGGTKFNYSENFRIKDENGGASTISNFTVNKSEVNVYLDKYDYAIYVSGVEAAKNYAAVIGVGESNQYGSSTAGVTLLLADGTQVTAYAKMDDWSVLSNITVVGNNVTASANLVNEGTADLVTYTVGDDGIYTLTPVGDRRTSADGVTPVTKVYTGKYENINAAGANNTTFETGKSLMNIKSTFTPGYTANTQYTPVAAANQQYYTTSETIFMVCTNGTNGKTYNVYTGYANAPTIDNSIGINGIAFGINSYYTNRIDVVYIDANRMAGIAGVNTFFVKAKNATVYTDSDGQYYRLPAVVNNEITEIRIDARLVKDWNLNGTPVRLDATGVEGLFALNNILTNSKGIITGCDMVNLVDASGVAGTGAFAGTNGDYGTGTVAANGAVLGIDNSANLGTNRAWAYDANTKVFKVSDDYKTITASTVEGVNTDANDKIWVTTNSNNKMLTVAFVCDVPNTVSNLYINASTGILFSKTFNGGYAPTLTNVAKDDVIYVVAADVTAKPVYVSTMTDQGYNPAGNHVYSFVMPDKDVAPNTYAAVSCGYAINGITAMAGTAAAGELVVTMSESADLTLAKNAGAITWLFQLSKSTDGGANYTVLSGMTWDAADSKFTGVATGAGAFKLTITAMIGSTQIATYTTPIGFTATVASW